MIVCSCNVITDKEIAAAVASLRAVDPLIVVTPGLVFRALGKRPQCGNCLPLVSRVMVAAGAPPAPRRARTAGPDRPPGEARKVSR